MSPGPQQCRLPVGFQQASLTFVFDLRLAIKLSAGVIIVLVRVVMVSADMPCRCCGLGRVFYIHTPVGLTPFPFAGIYSCKFSHSGAQRAAALPAQAQVQHCSLSL